MLSRITLFLVAVQFAGCLSGSDDAAPALPDPVPGLFLEDCRTARLVRGLPLGPWLEGAPEGWMDAEPRYSATARTELRTCARIGFDGLELRNATLAFETHDHVGWPANCGPRGPLRVLAWIGSTHPSLVDALVEAGMPASRFQVHQWSEDGIGWQAEQEASTASSIGLARPASDTVMAPWVWMDGSEVRRMDVSLTEPRQQYRFATGQAFAPAVSGPVPQWAGQVVSGTSSLEAIWSEPCSS